MPIKTQSQATLDDLRRVKQKAELIGGRVVELMPTGFFPGQVAGRIYRSLDDYAVKTRAGVALPDNVGFAVSELSSGRQTFSPDASFHAGELPSDLMDFIHEAPTFAVEVCSKGDYGPSAEAEAEAKRADYFEAGTLVVWDVDPIAKIVHRYQADSNNTPRSFGTGEIADAEPAVPGWTIEIDQIFRQ